MNRIAPPAALAYELFDSVGGTLGRTVNIRLPKPDDSPAFLLQQSVVSPITITVSLDFWNPVGCVCASAKLVGKLPPVPSMPKVAVAENRESCRGENNIWLS